jgi:hypothetical protein
VKLDKRLHAYRTDLADENLREKIVAEKYVTGHTMEIIVPVTPLHREPSNSGMQVTQAIFGEKITAFEVAGDWIWCQLQNDGYVGYIARSAASPQVTDATHRVSVPKTFMYSKGNIKSQPVVPAYLNAKLEVVDTDGAFSRISNGSFVYSRHLEKLSEPARDFVEVAERFLEVPYYWGGKTSEGLDCSGLVQSSLEACGMPALRDTDMQERQLGRSLLINDLDGLQRGDLVFWNGHVGIMCDAVSLLHANGFHMMTVKEPLAEAIQRIMPTAGPVTSIKRF